MSTAPLTTALVRLTAPWTLSNPHRIARHLLAFSHTEAGSALDMLRAAELVDDPALSRLFLHHALDEDRHARLFREAAHRTDPALRGSEYDLARARRQDLLERWGLLDFTAFIYLSEREGQRRFEVLAEHFSDDTALHALFHRIAQEEKFHVSYSHKLLRRWTDEGRGREVRLALMRVRARKAWETWRNAGRMLGDKVARGCVTLVCLLTLPLFAALVRRSSEKTGWHDSPPPSRTLDRAQQEL